MSRSSFRPGPAPGRGKSRLLLWCLGLFAVGGGLSAVLWAPPERATLFLTLAGLVLTGITAWWGPHERR